MSASMMDERLFCRHTCIAIRINLFGGGNELQGVVRYNERQDGLNS